MWLISFFGCCFFFNSVYVGHVLHKNRLNNLMLQDFILQVKMLFCEIYTNNEKREYLVKDDKRAQSILLFLQFLFTSLFSMKSLTCKRDFGIVVW